MALSASSIFSDTDAADQTSYAFAVGSIPDGEMAYALVVNTKGSAPDTPTLSGHGVTWTQVATIAASNNDRTTLFRAVGTFTSGNITADFAGATQTACHLHVISISGADTGGTNGANSVVQSDTETGSSGNGQQADLSAFADATNNGCIVAGTVNANDADFDVEAGFTALSELVGGSRRSIIGFRTGEDTSPGLVWSTTSRTYTIVCAEIAIAGGGAETITPAGTITPDGALAKKAAKALAGTVTPDGSLAKKVAKALAGDLAPDGSITKKVGKALAGDLAPDGALTRVATLSDAHAGTVTPDGSLTIKVTKALAGTVTPDGSLALAAIKAITPAGTVTPDGTLTRVATFADTHGGTITPAATLALVVKKSLAGTITPAGELSNEQGTTGEHIWTIQDTFTGSSLDSQWTDFADGDGSVVVDDQLELTTPDGASGFAGVVSDALYTLLGCSTVVELIDAGDQGSGQSCGLELKNNGENDNKLVFIVSEGFLTIIETVAGSGSVIDFDTYDDEAHRWLRIRETGGDVFFETSADGLTYVAFADMPTPAWGIDNVTVGLYVGQNGTDPATTAIFDNLNVIPVLGGSVTPDGALTRVRTSTRSLGGTVTPDGALTLVKTLTLSFGGTIAPAGSLDAEFVEGPELPALEGTIAPAATLALVASLHRSFSGSITPTGRVCLAIPLVALDPGTLTLDPLAQESVTLGEIGDLTGEFPGLDEYPGLDEFPSGNLLSTEFVVLPQDDVELSLLDEEDLSLTVSTGPCY